jgi:hypothetical protein
MKRLGLTFKDLIEYSEKEDKLFEGITFTCDPKYTLRNILCKFGYLLLGKYSNYVSYKETPNSTDYINLAHFNNLEDRLDLKEAMNYYGFVYSFTRNITSQEFIEKKMLKKYETSYITVYQGKFFTREKMREIFNLKWAINHVHYGNEII